MSRFGSIVSARAGGFTVALVVLCAGCGPDMVVDRVTPTPQADGGDVPVGQGGQSGAGGADGAIEPGGNGGTPGSGGSPTPEPAPDAAAEVGVDLAGPDLRPPVDLAPELPPPNGYAFLVVADPAQPDAGDRKLEALLVGKGFGVKLGDDDGVAAAATGTRVVVLAGSCDSQKLMMKYRDLPFPVLVLEPGALPGMAMSANDGDTDFGLQDATSISIVMAGHQLAANKTMTVAVVSATSRIGWGKPAATALRIANVNAMAAKAAIFAYEKNVLMIGTVLAPARRVGLFASSEALPRITANGEAFVGAAIDWLTATM